ncbi:MAG TPA: hypothetical protein IGS31_05130 [Oscillatoriales cyanobacterium M4454_W2019_049]|nr:hypothetical protein [Oscillatoriales cyanobacterium M4454_W2019_049]
MRLQNPERAVTMKITAKTNLIAVKRYDRFPISGTHPRILPDPLTPDDTAKNDIP